MRGRCVISLKADMEPAMTKGDSLRPRARTATRALGPIVRAESRDRHQAVARRTPVIPNLRRRAGTSDSPHRVSSAASARHLDGRRNLRIDTEGDEAAGLASQRVARRRRRSTSDARPAAAALRTARGNAGGSVCHRALMSKRYSVSAGREPRRSARIPSWHAFACRSAVRF
jgi:hypothetical protein